MVPGTGTLVDVRVDRSDDPLGDLARLLDAHDAYAAFHAGVNELFEGHADEALESVDAGLGTLPGEENLRFLRAGALMATGSIDDGIAEVRALIAERPTWAVIVRSFARKGLLTLPNGVTINSVLG
jgi:predicted Zn-dependent protease